MSPMGVYKILECIILIDFMFIIISLGQLECTDNTATISPDTDNGVLCGEGNAEKYPSLVSCGFQTDEIKVGGVNWDKDNAKCVAPRIDSGTIYARCCKLPEGTTIDLAPTPAPVAVRICEPEDQSTGIYLFGCSSYTTEDVLDINIGGAFFGTESQPPDSDVDTTTNYCTASVPDSGGVKPSAICVTASSPGIFECKRQFGTSNDTNTAEVTCNGLDSDFVLVGCVGWSYDKDVNKEDIYNIQAWWIDGTTCNAQGINDSATVYASAMCCKSIPTPSPTKIPTAVPTPDPTTVPTTVPTAPSQKPTTTPTTQPTTSPTNNPSTNPSKHPTKSPTYNPSISPTNNPSTSPSKYPTKSPTLNPSKYPSKSPTENPSTSPSKSPTKHPTKSPTYNPSKSPTWEPTFLPTNDPTSDPTTDPTSDPTTDPTINPTFYPTPKPTDKPTPRPIYGTPTQAPIVPPPSASPTQSPTPSPEFPKEAVFIGLGVVGGLGAFMLLVGILQFCVEKKEREKTKDNLSKQIDIDQDGRVDDDTNVSGFMLLPQTDNDDDEKEEEEEEENQAMLEFEREAQQEVEMMEQGVNNNVIDKDNSNLDNF